MPKPIKAVEMRAKVRLKKTGAEFIGTPASFGMRAPDGNFYNRAEYKILKRYPVGNNGK